MVAEAALGEVTAATVRHERLTADDEWRWLPAAPPGLPRPAAGRPA
ncbi:hypothetical protein OG767_11750 [Micromonospora sp. NBC_01392]